MNMTLSQNYPHLDQMQPWNDRLHLLECLSVIEEAPNVKTFTFKSDNHNWFRYEPGQFMTFELPVQPEAVLRTYTLSSSAVTAIHDRRDGQGAGRQYRHALDAGSPDAGRAAEGLRPARRLLDAQASWRKVSVHLSRVGHHADDVDDPLDARLRAAERYQFRHLRTPSERHHFPQGTRISHELHAQPEARLSLSRSTRWDRSGRASAAGSKRPSCRCSRRTSRTGPSSAAGRKASCGMSAPCLSRPASTCRIIIRRVSVLPPNRSCRCWTSFQRKLPKPHRP